MSTDRLSNRLAKIEAISKPQGYVVWLNDDGSIPGVPSSGCYILAPRPLPIEEWTAKYAPGSADPSVERWLAQHAPKVSG